MSLVIALLKLLMFKKKISSSPSRWEFHVLTATLEIFTHQGVQKTFAVRTETQTRQNDLKQNDCNSKFGFSLNYV